jgi:serine/threonine protein kinase
VPKLIVEKGADRGVAIELPAGGSVVIGREAEGFRLKDSWASRQHFRLESRPDGCYVIDMNSLNGTFLDGHRIGEARLSNGALIKVGETLFTFVEDDAKDALVGLRLAGYRIVERVGRGGMGTVYKAEQIDLQRTVAVKVISTEFSNNREFIERFINEARAAAQLNHANVVQVYDVRRDGKIYFFSMEFMHQGSLQSLLGLSKKLSPMRAVRMILDASRGLEYAHAKQIVHRDIKPDNMMVADTGTVKIGDLGLAAGLHDRAGGEEERYVLGTPHYIAPEQLLGKPADFRSDIYSLGSSLYRLLAGRPPFSGHGAQEIVNKKVREDAPRLEESAPGLPPAVVKLVHRMIEREPEKRPQTMTEVVHELEGIHDELRTSEKATGRRVPEQAGPAWKRWVRQPAALAAGGIALLLAAVLGVSFFWPRDPPPSNPTIRNPDGGFNPDHAKDVLGTAMIDREKLNAEKSTPEAIEAVIKKFERVISDFKGTPEAAQALVQIGELRKMQEAVVRRGALESHRSFDAQQWDALGVAFAAGTPDVGPIREVAARYRTFGGEPAYQGTSAAQEARERADHVEGWLRAYEARQKEYEQLEQELKSASDEGRWAKGAALLDAFLAKEAAFPKWKFGEPRYDTLLWDRLVRRRETAFEGEARDAFRRLDDEVRGYVRDEKFEEAEALIARRREDFAAEPDFKKLERRFKDEHRDFKEAAAKRMEEQRQKLLEEDRLAFDREARRLFDGLIRTYRFEDARQELARLDARLQTQEYKIRLGERIGELDRAQKFLEAFAEAARAPNAGIKYPEDIETGKFYAKMPITGVRNQAFVIRSGVGEALKLFRDFADKPEEFLRVLKTWADPGSERAGLAFLAMELGEYDEARALFDQIGDAPARAYVQRIESMNLIQTEEEQVLRRYTRVKALVDARKFEEAARRYEGLRDPRFARTTLWAEKETEIRAWDVLLKEWRAAAAAKEQIRRLAERANKGLLLHQQRAAEQALKLADKIKQASWPIDQKFEQALAWGLYHYGRSNWPDASRYLKQAADAASLLRTTKTLADDTDRVTFMLFAYMRLAEVEVLSGRAPNTAIAQAETFVRSVFKDAESAPEPFKEWKRSFPEWQALRQKSKAEADALKEKEERLKQDPSDPDQIWELAEGLFTLQRNFTAARGWFKVLIDEYPDHPRVKDGDALHRYAECSFFLLDLSWADRDYNELGRNHPTHPRARGRTTEDAASVRVELVKKLAEKLRVEE